MKLGKFIMAILLLPFIWSSTQTFSKVLSLVTHGQIPWLSVGLFTSGFILWLLLFLTRRRLTTLYVFQHEATHALAVWMSGGKVSKIHVSREGGHIIANQTSAWISLAPYIIPLYPLLSGTIWSGVVWLYSPAQEWTPYFLFLWGIIWSFHFSFTITLLKTEQSDFSSQGYVFSWVTISLTNIWMVTLLIWAWLKPIPLWKLLELSGGLTKKAYLSIFDLITHLLNMISVALH